MYNAQVTNAWHRLHAFTKCVVIDPMSNPPQEDNTPFQTSEDPKKNRTIRFSDEEWERFKKAAEKHMKNLGIATSVGGMVSTLALTKLQEFETDGYLTVYG